jgi:hypothetical protein
MHPSTLRHLGTIDAQLISRTHPQPTYLVQTAALPQPSHPVPHIQHSLVSQARPVSLHLCPVARTTNRTSILPGPDCCSATAQPLQGAGAARVSRHITHKHRVSASKHHATYVSRRRTSHLKTLHKQPSYLAQTAALPQPSHSRVQGEPASAA